MNDIISKGRLPGSRLRNAQRTLRAYANRDITAAEAVVRLDAAQFRTSVDALYLNILDEEGSGNLTVVDAANNADYVFARGSY